MNIPKLNTKSPKGKYTVIGNIENSGKLTANLNNTAQSDLMDVITKEWETLVVLTRRYWDGEQPPAATTVRRQMTCQKCSAKISGDVDVGDANSFGKYDCPSCKKKGCVVPDQ